MRGDWASALNACFDLVVSNPPYVETPALDGLEPEVARWEPRAALDGGPDGLDAYRRIVPGLASLLRAAELARECGLAIADRRKDLAGRDRCLILTR